MRSCATLLHIPLVRDLYNFAGSMYVCWVAELSNPAMPDIWGRVVDDAQVECHKGLRFLHVTTTRKPYHMDGIV